MSKIALLDGSNLYNKLKRVDNKLSTSNLHYRDFVEYVIKSKANYIGYYVGEILPNKNDKKTWRLYKNQNYLFNGLTSQKISVKKGYLLKTNGVYHEKGVDVQIAVDMLDMAFDNKYNECYLFSSDTDLIPAIKSAQKRGKKIIYVAFENYLSHALNKVCNNTLFISKQMVISSQQRNNRKWLKK